MPKASSISRASSTLTKNRLPSVRRYRQLRNYVIQRRQGGGHAPYPAAQNCDEVGGGQRLGVQFGCADQSVAVDAADVAVEQMAAVDRRQAPGFVLGQGTAAPTAMDRA